jgi:hypothetical protein
MKPDAVDHAVATEPVMFAWRLHVDRVAGVADVPALKLCRDLADHLKVEGRYL